MLSCRNISLGKVCIPLLILIQSDRHIIHDRSNHKMARDGTKFGFVNVTHLADFLFEFVEFTFYLLAHSTTNSVVR
jgi:hypothetical protein